MNTGLVRCVDGVWMRREIQLEGYTPYRVSKYSIGTSAMEPWNATKTNPGRVVDVDVNVVIVSLFLSKLNFENSLQLVD